MKKREQSKHQQLREEIISSIRELQVLGLLSGTAGNLSARTPEGAVLITPSGLDYTWLRPEDIVLVDVEGRVLAGDLVPSSEVAMHTRLYRCQPQVGGIVHSHARYSTVLACLGWEIPPIHYMLAAIARDGRIPLAPYALYGSEELAQSAVQTLDEVHRGCLLQNHGNLTVGATLRQAHARSIILEEMAEVYYHARLAGEPRLLSTDQIAEVYTQLAHYGQPKADPPDANSEDNETLW
jgi:L-fuculose-phosphate aldolase